MGLDIYAHGNSSKIEDKATDFTFRAGSYGSYGDFRDLLAKMAGYKADTTQKEGRQYIHGCWAEDSGYFYEMLYFSDCDGVIDAKDSLKLSGDFEYFDDKYEDFFKKNTDHSIYYTEVYKNFKKAFKMASNGGYVLYQ